MTQSGRRGLAARHSDPACVGSWLSGPQAPGLQAASAVAAGPQAQAAPRRVDSPSHGHGPNPSRPGMPGPARPRGQLSERLRVTVAQALAGPCSVTVGWVALRHSEPGSWQQGSRRVTSHRDPAWHGHGHAGGHRVSRRDGHRYSHRGRRRCHGQCVSYLPVNRDRHESWYELRRAPGPAARVRLTVTVANSPCGSHQEPQWQATVASPAAAYAREIHGRCFPLAT